MNLPEFSMLINYIYLGYFWLILAVLFLFAEISTPGLFFFIAFAMGSIVASGFAFLAYPFAFQCIIALGSAIFSFFVLRYFFSRKNKSVDAETNVDALIGKKGIVIKEIFPNKFGRVKIGGESWLAESSENSILDIGMVIEVVSVKGSKLIVK
ncbi:hypothetical protein GF322_04910 [Candidatus Dependentiae bacterium]|nr:hypothetical protein [Candidatus Dependentiae bacterium]